jgi:CubicO group peptidase (beta-lactamase class C family)
LTPLGQTRPSVFLPSKLITKETPMRRMVWMAAVSLALLAPAFAAAEDKKPELTNYFPPPESKGGWRSLLPDKGDPSAAQKEDILTKTGVDWDMLNEAWKHNANIEGGSGVLVIRKGYVVGEWYNNATASTTYNIYSSSKAYTSLAFGLLLQDSENGKLPANKKLTLDTKVCNQEWLPESLPLSDPRRADITLQNLLNMASGIGGENLPTNKEPFEIALGHTENSPFAKLKGDPGKVFNYSNAGVAHLVLVFNHVAGKDLYQYLKERVFEPVGMEKVTWDQIGGKDGKIGPFSQGYSGVNTTPREHARFLYLALHKGEWNGKPVVPAAHYDFAWKSSEANPQYGAQWWVYPRHKEGPKDLVQTAGANNNHGYVVPSMDLVFVRLGSV